MKVLVIAAHADDEVLGVGGTIARLAAEGHDVFVTILADGIALRHPNMTLAAMHELARQANQLLGTRDVSFGGFEQDGHLLDRVSARSLGQFLADQLKRVTPELVFTHHPGDINVDHRIVANASFYAVRMLGLSSVRELLCYETLSSTEQEPGLVTRPFTPTVFYDIEPYLAQKREAFACYTTEIQPYPHARSLAAIEHLARYRGLQVAVGAAEAFSLVRSLR